jgi:molecular chaperone HscB
MSLLERDYFAVFGLPRAFELNLQALQEAYVRLQGAVHPDRLVNAPQSHKRLAMQLAAHVNQAKVTLEDPLKRASYLCELGGQAIHAEINTQMPKDFLMQQLEWREAVALALQASNSREQAVKQLLGLRAELLAALELIQHRLRELFRQQPLGAEAASLVRQWMFLDKLNSEIPG